MDEWDPFGWREIDRVEPEAFLQDVVASRNGPEGFRQDSLLLFLFLFPMDEVTVIG